MSSSSTLTPGNNHNAQRGRLLTPRGRKIGKKTAKIWGIFAAGVLTVLMAQNCGWNKNYDAPNQRPLTENPDYHNNGEQITLERVLAASNMFDAGDSSLVEDSFNNLYDQIDRTLDKKISLFSNQQNSHLNHGQSGKNSYHAYVGINEAGWSKEIVVSWHMPEPTAMQKAKGAVATHKVRFVLYPGQNTIQRYDHYSNWDETWPVSYSYDQLQTALREYEVLFR